LSSQVHHVKHGAPFPASVNNGPCRKTQGMKEQNRKMSAHLGVRLEPELVDEIQRWAETIRPRPTKSAAARELIIKGLEAAKVEAAKKPAKGGRGK